MDPEGYIPVDDLLESLRLTIPDVTAQDVHAVVQTVEPSKQRFTIDAVWIRANYGHSFMNIIEHRAATPPPVLYHGTSENSLARIRQQGLLPMGRQYVHLTTDVALAKKVGGRHGKPVVLEVDTTTARQYGTVFFRANTYFWLVSELPATCLLAI